MEVVEVPWSLLALVGSARDHTGLGGQRVSDNIFTVISPSPLITPGKRELRALEQRGVASAAGRVGIPSATPNPTPPARESLATLAFLPEPTCHALEIFIDWI